MSTYEILSVVFTVIGLLIAVSWAVLSGCVLGTLYVYIRAAFLSRTVQVSLALLVSVPLLVFFYGFFQANHYYSLGVSLVSKGNPEGAVGYFTKAIDLNPLQTEYLQYRANTLSSILNLTTQFSSSRGDTDAPSNDYERALKDYAAVLKHAPNHVMIHQNIGQLYYTMAIRQSKSAAAAANETQYNERSQSARQNMEQAKRAFERSLKLDPVNGSTYLFLASIALMEYNPERAQYWVDAYRRGPEGVTEENFLLQNRTNPRFDAVQKQIDALRGSVGKKPSKK